MAGTIRVTDPTPVVVRNLVARGTAGILVASSTIKRENHMVSITFERTASGTAFGWINPEAGTVMAQARYVIQGSAGTGALDLGTGTDGTGVGTEWYDGGTLTAGVHIRNTFDGTVAASATSGQLALEWRRIAASGTGGDSIVGTLDDVEATMGTFQIQIDYYKLGD